MSPADIGLQFLNWKPNSMFGIAAGAIFRMAMVPMVRIAPPDPRHDFTYRVRRGSPQLRVLMPVTTACPEEVWIALSLVVLKGNIRWTWLSVLLVVIAFAPMHYSYHFGVLQRRPQKELCRPCCSCIFVLLSARFCATLSRTW